MICLFCVLWFLKFCERKINIYEILKKNVVIKIVLVLLWWEYFIGWLNLNNFCYVVYVVMNILF